MKSKASPWQSSTANAGSWHCVIRMKIDVCSADGGREGEKTSLSFHVTITQTSKQARRKMVQIQRTMTRGELLTDRKPALPAGKRFALRDPAALPSETGVATDTGTRTQQMNEEGVTDDVFRGVINLFKCR